MNAQALALVRLLIGSALGLLLAGVYLSCVSQELGPAAAPAYMGVENANRD